MPDVDVALVQLVVEHPGVGGFAGERDANAGAQWVRGDARRDLLQAEVRPLRERQPAAHLASSSTELCQLSGARGLPPCHLRARGGGSARHHLRLHRDRSAGRPRGCIGARLRLDPHSRGRSGRVGADARPVKSPGYRRRPWSARFASLATRSGWTRSSPSNRDGLGLAEIGGFRDHDGYDGAFLEIPGVRCPPRVHGRWRGGRARPASRLAAGPLPGRRRRGRSGRRAARRRAGRPGEPVLGRARRHARGSGRVSRRAGPGAPMRRGSVHGTARQPIFSASSTMIPAGPRT